jgi:hypothetical protein
MRLLAERPEGVPGRRYEREQGRSWVCAVLVAVDDHGVPLLSVARRAIRESVVHRVAVHLVEWIL